MKNISLEQVTTLIGGLTMFSLFAKENLNSISFIAFLFFIVLLFIKKKNKPKFSKTFIIVSILMISYYLLGVYGILINSESKSSYFTRLFPFLICPLLIYHFSANRDHTKFLLKVFILGNLTLLVFLDFWAIADIIKNKSIFIEQEGREYYRFLYTRYTQDYFNHIYLSSYSFLSAILLLQFNLVRKKIKWVIIIYILIHLFMMGSRAMVIAIIGGAILYLIIASINNKKNIKFLFIFIISLSTLVGITYFFRNTLFFNRYAQVFEWYEKKDVILERNYSINNRIKIYMIGLSACSDHSGFIKGTGIAEQEIKDTYLSEFKNQFSFKTKTYNTHNQYINNYLDWGYLGLIILIGLFVIIIQNSMKQQLFWVSFFWICLSILFLMECVIYRHRGIMLYILFYSLFLKVNTNCNTKLTRNE